jgi:Na+/citrate or Na+/malate symporter
MINWKWAGIGAVLIIILSWLFNPIPLLYLDLLLANIIGGLLVGILVGYMVGNGAMNCATNGALAGLIGGIIPGIFPCSTKYVLWTHAGSSCSRICSCITDNPICNSWIHRRRHRRPDQRTQIKTPIQIIFLNFFR